MKKTKLAKLFYVIPAFPLIVVLYAIYSPGLNGVFLLDDVGNLWPMDELSEGGSIADWIAFVFGGIGSLGRPLSLLTFAIQYESWPHVASFKMVNYVLHIINFLLVSFLLFNTVRVIKPQFVSGGSRIFFVVSLGLAFLWATAPIHTTTVQYVIQRMTLLAAFWMLLGLNVWVVFLSRIESSKSPDWSLFCAVTLVLFCTAAGVLSKENAIILPLLCVLYLLIYPQRLPIETGKKSLMFSLLLSPVICLLFVMLMDFDKYFVSKFSFRNFNAYERLLTQLEIVPKYIFKFVYPIGQDFVLFNENHIVVRSFFESWRTILGAIGFFGIHILAWSVRTKFPLIFFGVFFYSTGHVLESSALSLELYFEHRNYLPSVGILFLVVGVLGRFSKNLCVSVFAAFFVIYGGVNSLITFQESKIWGSPLQQAIHWYKQNPKSDRAHGHLAAQLVSYGYYAEASEFYRKTIEEFENDVTKPLLWLELQCATEGELADINIRAALLRYAQNSSYYKEVRNIIGSILRRYESNQCNNRVVSELEDTILVLLENESFSRDRTDLLITLSKLNFYQDDVSAAREFMMIAHGESERIDVMLSLAQIEIALGHRNIAKRYLSEAESKCSVRRGVECLKLRQNFKELAEELSR